MLGQGLKVICDCLAMLQIEPVGVCSNNGLRKHGFGPDHFS